MVDNFGRTSYMKAKVASSRKISRLGEYDQRHHSRLPELLMGWGGRT